MYTKICLGIRGSSIWTGNSEDGRGEEQMKRRISVAKTTFAKMTIV